MAANFLEATIGEEGGREHRYEIGNSIGMDTSQIEKCKLKIDKK